MSYSSEPINVEELVARRTVEDYGTFSVVAIPGFSDLSEADRRAICARIVEIHDNVPTLDLNAVDTALQNFSRHSSVSTSTCWTPPPDLEAREARACERETQARNDLIEAGCPPCYPTDFEFPLRNVPEKCPEYEVISYWRSLPASSRLVLTAQLADWRVFCDYQKKVRRHYSTHKPFPLFQERVRDRLRRHGLEGDVCLHVDIEQQSQLENWIEFQSSHLEIYESHEKKIQADKEELNAERNRLETGASGSTETDLLKHFQWQLMVSESKLRRHKKLLRWIEQQRIAMTIEQTSSIHTAKGYDRLRTMPGHSPILTPTPTPPPDLDAGELRAHEREKQARNDLVEAGCPPCYPIDFEFPLRNVPEKCPEYEVISYWRSLPRTSRLVLSAQLEDWKAFRDYQKSVRRYYSTEKPFPRFQEWVRDGRRRHGLEGDVCLHADPEQQNGLENWMEFQNFHLEIHDGYETDIKVNREKADAERNRVETGASGLTDADVLEHLQSTAMIHESSLEQHDRLLRLMMEQRKEEIERDERNRVETGASGLTDAEVLEHLQSTVLISESRLQQHDKLLRWIEQQRIAMTTEQATSVHTTKGYDPLQTVPTPPCPGRRKRDQKPRSPLSPARSAVCKKPAGKRRSLRLQQRAAPQPAEIATADSSAPRRSKRISDLGDEPSRRGKQAGGGKKSSLLRPVHPQRVTKTAKNSPARKDRQSGKVPSKPQPTSPSPRRKPMPQSPAGVVKTRSGREIRRPERIDVTSDR